MKFINISPNGAVLFDSLVQKTPAFVKFYNEGCGHCKDMEESWKNLKDEIKPYENIDINVIDVHSDAIPKIKSKCAKNINGYPTIIEVLPGGEPGIEHTSERTTKELMKTIKKIMKKHKQKDTAGRPSSPTTPRRRILTTSPSLVPERLSFQEEWDDAFMSDNDNLDTLEQISENTQNQINRNNISPVGMREIMKKAKIWAEHADNTIAEQHHPVDGLSEDDEERLRQEASHIRALRNMPESVRNSMTIDLTGEGIKSRKKRKYKPRRKKTRGIKHGKKHGKKRRTRYRYVKRPKHYSRIRR